MLMQLTTLETWAGEVLERIGYPTADASFLAATLVDANSRGVDSHGVIRLPAYERRITEKLVNPTAEPVVTTNGSVVSIDANGAAGQLAARRAAEEVLRLSKETGIATAVVRGSAHFGSAGFYARWLADNGAIGMVLSNSEPIVVPHGGRDALLGTNPMAFAAPTQGLPVSLDMATSTVAMGKVMVAQAEGRPVPSNWGVDENGASSTDASAITALLPVGGPKGYGLGFLIEILGGVLSGASVAHGIGNMYTDFSRPQDVGHWMMAMDIEHFMPLDAFKDRIQVLGDMAHATPPAVGFDRVLVPGEPEERTREQRLAEGVVLPGATVEELSELGARYGVAFPEGAAQ